VTLVLAAVVAFLVGVFATRGHFEIAPAPAGLLVGGVAGVYLVASVVGFDRPLSVGLAVEAVAFGLIMFIVPLLGSRLRKRLDRQRV
jgi:hypothetical protein